MTTTASPITPEIQQMIDTSPTLSEHLDRWGNLNDRNNAPAGFRKIYTNSAWRTLGDDPLVKAAKGLDVKFAKVATYEKSGNRWDTNNVGIVVQADRADEVIAIAELIATGRIAFRYSEERFGYKPPFEAVDKTIRVIVEQV